MEFLKKLEGSVAKTEKINKILKKWMNKKGVTFNDGVEDAWNSTLQTYDTKICDRSHRWNNKAGFRMAANKELKMESVSGALESFLTFLKWANNEMVPQSSSGGMH